MQKYSQLAKLHRQCTTEKRSLKTIIFQHSSDPVFVRQAYALLTRALNHSDAIEDALYALESKTEQEIRDPNLVTILMLELFNPAAIKAKRIGGVIARLLKQNKELIQSILDKHGVFNDTEIKRASVRLILPNEEQMKAFMELEPIADPHVPNLYTLQYSNYSVLAKANLNSNWFTVQSKASAMPPYLLLRSLQKLIGLKKIGFDIIDCCAAPGNKTLQLAEFCRSNGIEARVLAFERSEERFQVLQRRIKQYGFDDIVECFNEDFLQVNVTQKRFKNVRMIMLDPSCSGSGMLQQRMVGGGHVAQTKVGSLATMQKDLLQKCSEFPRVLRLIYSTCSLYQEENEEVSEYFLQQNPNWRSVKVFKEWEHRGINNPNFVRFDPERDNTDGFFIALFKRIK